MRNSNFPLMLILMLLALLSVSIQSCKDDPCDAVACQNGGVPQESGDDCICNCDTGYEGDRCETEVRAKFISSYTVQEQCGSGSFSYQIVIIGSSTDVTKILINNFYDSFSNPVSATVNGNQITIALQDPDSDGFNVSGSGSLSGNVLTLTFTVVDTTDGSSDGCTATATKQ